MLFKEIKGLTRVKEVLIRGALTDNVAHALLFSGRQGAPALQMALALPLSSIVKTDLKMMPVAFVLHV